MLNMDVPTEISNVAKLHQSEMVDLLKSRPIASYQHADYQLELLKEQIQSFESQLKDDEQIALLISNFGTSLKLYVSQIDFANPNLLYFYGYLDGQPNRCCQLVQHVNQLNFLITSALKMAPGSPRIPIGFSAR